MAPEPLAPGLLLLFPLRQAPAGILGLLFGLFAGFGFQSGLGFTDLPQAALAAGKLSGELIAARSAEEAVLLLVGPLCLAEEFGHLAGEFVLFAAQALVAHGFVLGGCSFHLGAVQGHVPELHRTGLLTQPQNLQEEVGEGGKVAATEVGEAVVVGMLVGRKDPEGHLLIGGPLDLAGGGLAQAVGERG